MKQASRLSSFIALTAFLGLLSACGASAPSTETVKKVSLATSAAPTSSNTSSTLAQASWVTAPLTNANTGQTFRISDFQGKVVLVEMMAVWCTNCLQQQGHVKTLHQTVLGQNKDSVVSISMDVDPNENSSQLNQYRDKQGFDWGFTVAPSAVAREISNLYGAQFLNPSSVPMIIIDKQGVAHPLPYGIKTVETLQDALKPYLQ